MSDHWHREHRKARKEHRCEMCGRIIERAERYMRGVGFHDGSAHSWNECGHCEALYLLADLADWCDETYDEATFADMEPRNDQEKEWRWLWGNRWRTGTGELAEIPKRRMSDPLRERLDRMGAQRLGMPPPGEEATAPMLAALRAVLDIHQCDWVQMPGQDRSPGHCRTCIPHINYPCPTVRSIAQALGVRMNSDAEMDYATGQALIDAVQVIVTKVDGPVLHMHEGDTLTVAADITITAGMAKDLLAKGVTELPLTSTGVTVHCGPRLPEGDLNPKQASYWAKRVADLEAQVAGIEKEKGRDRREAFDWGCGDTERYGRV